jgi:hypothetical protein
MIVKVCKISLALVCAVAISVTSNSISRSADAGSRHVEAIYVVRSLRDARVAPTEFCDKSRTGFEGSNSQDHFTLRSISVRTSDGLLVDNNVRKVGELRACFAPTADPKLTNFYAAGVVGGVHFTGRGECLAGVPDVPEPGIVHVRCFLHLADLSPPYADGELTSNSVRSRKLIGAISDPAGYTQPSIVTIRLWRPTGSP